MLEVHSDAEERDNMTTEELEQSQKDLGVRKRDLSTQVRAILDANLISSRGKNRIIEAVINFPDVKSKITDSTEAALVNLIYEAKNVQIAMFTIQSAIDQANQKGE